MAGVRSKRAAPWAQVPTFSVRLMTEVLIERGVDPEPLRREARIPVGRIDRPDSHIGWQQEQAFQRGFAAATQHDPTIWLDIGSRYTWNAFDVLGLAWLSSPTLRHFRALLRFDSFYSAARFAISDDDTVRGLCGYEARPPTVAEDVYARFTVWRDVAAAVEMMDDLWRSPFPLERLEIPLATVPQEFEQRFRATVVTGSDAVRWWWRRDLLDVPLPRANPALYDSYVTRTQSMAGWVRSAPTIDEEISEVLRRPGNSGMSLAQIAAELLLSERTLQRRLRDHEVSFSELRDSARLHEASRLLSQSDTPVSEIAGRLGYVETASFSSAFRRWTGETPSRFRTIHRSGSGDQLPSGPVARKDTEAQQPS